MFSTLVFNLLVALCSASFLLSKSLNVEGVFGEKFGLKPELFPKLFDDLKPATVGFLKFPFTVDVVLLKPLLDGDKFFLCGLEELKSLKDLLDSGAITKDEFDKAKKKLLN